MKLQNKIEVPGFDKQIILSWYNRVEKDFSKKSISYPQSLQILKFALSERGINPETLHFCPDWDEMLISELDPEIESCLCELQLTFTH